MSDTATSDQTAGANPVAQGVDMRLEVVVLPVADVDRSKDFYTKLGWRLDADLAAPNGFRLVQVTPPHSKASVIFGSGITSAPPGSIDTVLLAVDDLDRARAELIGLGVEVSDIYQGAGFDRANEDARIPGRDPDGRSYSSYASFEDPDGNGWLLQEIRQRLPGREWSEDEPVDVPRLAELLKETGLHHDAFEKSHEPHDWWDWYAPYLDARERGEDSDAAKSAADRYAEDVRKIKPLPS
jgi:catechol 2,3-dioxygenase-like lactoylglutathione lyase family enzyme